MRALPLYALAALWTALPGAGHTADFFTPPMRTVGGSFICQAVNISSAAQNLRIEFWSYTGTRLSYTTASKPIPAGNVIESSHSAPSGTATTVYCKVIADNRSVRAALSVYSFHDANSPAATVAAQ